MRGKVFSAHKKRDPTGGGVVLSYYCAFCFGVLQYYLRFENKIGGVTRGLLSEVCQCASAFEIQVCQCASWFSILISLCALILQKRDDDEKIAASNSIWN